jgi:citrate synthase
VWFETAIKLHEAVNREKGLIPNVDFYSAPLFKALGIPVDLFVPVIAVSRIAGWTANLLEQYADNRLIRPRADYVGPARREVRALAGRGDEKP